jgi:tripartite motif-containing protein 71
VAQVYFVAVRSGLHARLLVATAVTALVSPLVAVGTAHADVDPLPTSYGTGDGTLPGQFLSPGDAAVDTSGNVYVSDSAANRISVFAPDGTFLRAFGWDVIPGNASTGPETCTMLCQAGTAGGGAGQLSYPLAVRLDGSELYVADRDNNRISVFTTAGGFVRTFGGNVDPTGGTGFETCTATCQAGTAGGAAGQLDHPVGVTTDGSGNVFVSDSGNSRISVFGANGSSFERAFGADVVPGGSLAPEICAVVCKTGVHSVVAGGLNVPGDLALDGAGDLIVAGGNSQRIDVFTTAGTFVRAFGVDVDPGGGGGYEICTTSCKQGDASGLPGGVFSPADVAVDSQGNLWVADLMNQRVSEYTVAGGFLEAFGFDVVPGNATTGYEVCVSSCKSGVAGNGSGELNDPNGITTACNGQVYVTEIASHRVQRFGESGTPLPPCTTSTPPGTTPPGTPPPGTTPPGTTGRHAHACSTARKKLKADKAMLKRLEKKHASTAAIKKARATVKKAKAKAKKAC